MPWIVARGGAAYARLGVGESRGTKVVCLNERFRNPGAYEVELGIPLRQLFDELGGGLRDGHACASIQVGGPLGGFIGPDDLDTPLSFEALREVGADLGHGSLIALDERVDREALERHFWRFAASESCGTCAPVPARHPSRARARRGRRRRRGGRMATDEMLAAMERGSLCAFGRGVPPVVRSIERVYGGRARERLTVDGTEVTVDAASSSRGRGCSTPSAPPAPRFPRSAPTRASRPYGSCRTCMVAVEGATDPVAGVHHARRRRRRRSAPTTRSRARPRASRSS